MNFMYFSITDCLDKFIILIQYLKRVYNQLCSFFELENHVKMSGDII